MEKEKKEFKAERLPSGFYAIFADGIWIDAACGTIEQAEEKIREYLKEGEKKK